MFEYTYVKSAKVTITSDQVYTRGYQIPFGYQLTGEFRVPTFGDLFLHSFGDSGVVTAQNTYASDSPRLIVRKIPTKVITFRHADTHIPLEGEWYMHSSGYFYKAGDNHRLGVDVPREIYTRTETEE